LKIIKLVIQTQALTIHHGVINKLELTIDGTYKVSKFAIWPM